METYEIIIWSAFAGITVASFYAYYVKHIIGSFIRELIEKGAFSPENAVQPSGSGKVNSALLRFSLRKGSSLYDTVSSGEKDGWYIPQENVEKAKKKYKGDIKLYQVFIAVAVFLVIAILLSTYYNDIYRFVVKLIGDLFGE